MERHFYRIGEVAKLVDVPTHVLRYWESEFPQLKPAKGSGGQRLYKKQEIDKIKMIKSLLYDQGFTIEGARKTLVTSSRNAPTENDLDRAIGELNDIAAALA